LQDRLDGFLFRRVNKATSVHYDSISFARISCDLVASRLELTHHDLAIDEVLGTAQANKPNFMHKFLNCLLARIRLGLARFPVALPAKAPAHQTSRDCRPE
jgi:hypothetical protein